jgi:hypothetical protein
VATNEQKLVATFCAWVVGLSMKLAPALETNLEVN